MGWGQTSRSKRGPQRQRARQPQWTPWGLINIKEVCGQHKENDTDGVLHQDGGLELISGHVSKLGDSELGIAGLLVELVDTGDGGLSWGKDYE